MEYEILRTNDNNTATVQMTINGNVLVQDFDLGATQADLTDNIEQGMAVFQSELDRNTVPAYTPVLDTPVSVASLPTILAADLLPEPPVETSLA